MLMFHLMHLRLTKALLPARKRAMLLLASACLGWVSLAHGNQGATGEQVFEILASEIALQRGEPALAYQTYLSLARQTGDPQLAQRAMDAKRHAPPGHSGIGTTLSGSKIQLALMRAVLENYFTEEAFGPLVALAKRLEKGIADVIIKHGVAWHVVRVGARVEFMCTPDRPRNGGEAARVIHRPIDEAVHHYLLNRGVIVTPFHNMMLICPATTGSSSRSSSRRSTG